MQLKMWGKQLSCEQDVFDVFVCYLTGQFNKSGVKVREGGWRGRGRGVGRSGRGGGEGEGKGSVMWIKRAHFALLVDA